MFWIGIAIALLAGLLLIGLSREKVKTRYRVVTDYHLDVFAVALLLIGLAVSAAEHLQSERSLRALNQKVESRILSNVAVNKFVQRVAKEPKGKIRIKFMANDPDAFNYAAAIRAMLVTGGY